MITLCILVGIVFALWWVAGWIGLYIIGIKEDIKNYWRIKNGCIRRSTKTSRRTSKKG